MKNLSQWICKTLVVLATILAADIGLAQSRPGKVTVSGHVYDSSSEETLIGAGAVVERTGAVPVGSVTNSFGFYSITVPSGKATLRYSYVGYAERTLEIDLRRDTTINIRLEADSQIKEAVVAAQKESGIEATKMSAIEIPMTAIQNTPALFGEADVLKTIQLMPGVQAGNEGFSGIYVRGGGPDENLLLLDGISLYNAEHMLGLFSIFQPEAVKKVTLYKGSFPARYGGRTSSIIDVRTNDGNMNETHGTVGVSLLSDKFHLEGPLVKGKTAYSFSARGMHTVLFEPVLRAFKIPANYYFYDLNAKITHRFSDYDKLFFNVYNGRDRFYYKESEQYDSSSSYKDKTRINWGNTLAALRWNHVWDGKLFSNATLAYTGYSMKMDYLTDEKDNSTDPPGQYNYRFDYDSGLRDITAKMDFDYTPDPRHLVKFGAEYVAHTYMPETVSSFEHESAEGKVLSDTTYTFSGNKRRFGHELSAYIEDDFTLWNRLTLNPGLHISLFMTDGRAYYSPEPRLSAKLDFGKGFSAKAAYSRMSQYVHLLSSAQITLPLDLWVPITKDIKPVTSDQWSIGVYWNALPGWEFSLEGYWKNMHNILEYKDGAAFIGTSKSWEESVEMGEGRAYGLELFIEKTMGRTTGWLGYTLAKSDRIFPSGTINNGERFPYRYDRRHNISLVVNQQLGRNLDLSGTWTFATGGTTTVREREVIFEYPDGTFVQVDYSPHRNNYRLPPSHRLNLGLNLHVKKKHGEGIWNFSVYNAYDRMNPNFVFYDSSYEYDNPVYVKDEAEDYTYRKREKLTKLTLLPIIPSIGYTFKF